MSVFAAHAWRKIAGAMPSEEQTRFELEEVSGEFTPQRDRRVRIPEPLPVKLVAVADVRLPAPVNVEAQLDAFYVKMWGFERVPGAAERTYRSENFLLSFEIVEGIVARESLRPLGVEVQSLSEAEKKIIDAEIEYTRQRGLTPGEMTLLLLDPAGNWVELVEYKPVR